MDSGRQQTTLSAAQQELLELRGSGQRLLESITEAGNNNSKAQKVVALVRYQCINYHACSTSIFLGDGLYLKQEAHDTGGCCHPIHRKLPMQSGHPDSAAGSRRWHDQGHQHK